jgi:hypothetical protein
MNRTKIIFWVSTSIIFLLEGVMPALTSHTEMAKEGITSLGYPVYFGYMLTVAKVLGSLTLIIPQMPKTLKEWAYAGFTFDFVAAACSIAAVQGGYMTLVPLVFLGILIASYTSYHKLNDEVVSVVKQ